jgi:hypothetical protein
MTGLLYRGDKVKKTSGYEFDGVVVCRFHTTEGKIRYVVEHLQSPGLLHIFSPEQLIPDRPREIENDPENF